MSTVNISLDPEEAAWLARTLNLVMQMARQWDSLDGKQTGQRVVNKVQHAAVVFEEAEPLHAETVLQETGQRLAVAIRTYLFERGYDPDPKLERHDDGCATYDPYQSGPCDCGSEELLKALKEYESQ